MLMAVYMAFFRSVPLMAVKEISRKKNNMVASPKRLLVGFRKKNNNKTRKLSMHPPNAIYDKG